jgi:hypothetical protein
MRHDGKGDGQRLKQPLASMAMAEPDEGHVVFDFTGLEQSNIGDLSLILTARLQSAPTDNVWVRSIPWGTAQVLRLLKLDHLFRVYPEGDGSVN